MSQEYPCVYWHDHMCSKFSDEESLSFCVEGPCQYETPSNADRIRAMSDEELVDLLISADFCGVCDYRDKEGVCRYYESHPDGEIDDGCKRAANDWLQQPAGGDDNT